MNQLFETVNDLIKRRFMYLNPTLQIRDRRDLFKKFQIKVDDLLIRSFAMKINCDKLTFKVSASDLHPK